MQLDGKRKELFEAFSRMNASAYQDDALLSCPTLSKAPNYGNALQRFIQQTPAKPITKKKIAQLAWRYALTNFGHLLFLLLAKWYILLLGWRVPKSLSKTSLREGDTPVAIIDTFALLPQIADERTYKEMYLPLLADVAKEKEVTPILFFRFYGSRDPRVLWKACVTLSQIENSVTEVHLFRLEDWVTLVKHTLTFPKSLAKLIRSLSAYPVASPEYAIRSALVETAGQCVLLGEARRLAGFRLGCLLAAWPKRKNKSEAPRIFSWYENQTVNKVFQRGLYEAERTTGRHVIVIGMQLFVWPPSLLNNFPDGIETLLDLAPDVTLVSGEYFLPAQAKQRYAVGPSLRYQHLFTQDFVSECSKEDILVLLSYHPEETVKVLQAVLPLARSGTRVVYKFHPATNIEFFKDLLPPSPCFAESSLQDALKKASVAVGSGSGSLVEAVCLKTPAVTIVNPDEPEELSLNYMPPFGEGTLWAKAKGAEEIRLLSKELVAFQKNPEYETTRAAFQNMLFTEPTKEAIANLFDLS